MLKRIENLEETHEKIRNDIMDLIHTRVTYPHHRESASGTLK